MSGNDCAQQWAILVACNFYIRSEKNPQRWIGNLNGCVGDINRTYRYLLAQGMPKENITMLTSTAPPDYDEDDNDPIGMMPIEDPKDWPTYINIKHALERISRDPEKQKVKEGDTVYFHYSGHGSRTENKPNGLGGTSYPEEDWKGPRAQDELIVPSDSELTETDLDDVTLAYLFHNIAVERKLKLTVVLDCCHSGGATRSPIDDSNKLHFAPRFTSLGPRQTPKPYNIPASEIIPRKKLFDAWTKQQARGGLAHQGAMVNPSGYQLFAASRANEYAWETNVGTEPGSVVMGGALTHCLTSALEKNPNATQRMLLRKVDDEIQKIIQTVNMDERRLYKIRIGKADWATQVPIMEGSQDSFFISDRKGTPQNIATTGLRVLADKVVLAAGVSHGVTEGSVYAIYPWDATDLTDSSNAPQVRVTGVSSLSSDAVFLDEKLRFPTGTTGCQAVLLKPTDTPPAPNIPRECSPDESAHLTRFKTILDLKNSLSCPLLRGRFQMSIENETSTSTLTPTNGIYEVKHEGQYNLILKSDATVPIYMSCFILGTEWNVNQIYPLNSIYDVIYPGERRKMQFPILVTPGLDSSVDVMKCWLTTRPHPNFQKPVVHSPVNFRTLEMPKLLLASGGNLTSDWASEWIKAGNSSSSSSGSAPDSNEGQWETVQIILRATY